MRTKPVKGLLRLEATRLDPPTPEVFAIYDGLAGLSRRPILRDIVEELHRKGGDHLPAFLQAVVRCHRAAVHIYFHDYVSYGIGGGDATAEFFFGSYDILLVDADHPYFDVNNPPMLLMPRPDGPEQIALDSIVTES